MTRSRNVTELSRFVWLLQNLKILSDLFFARHFKGASRSLPCRKVTENWKFLSSMLNLEEKESKGTTWSKIWKKFFRVSSQTCRKFFKIRWILLTNFQIYRNYKFVIKTFEFDLINRLEMFWNGYEKKFWGSFQVIWIWTFRPFDNSETNFEIVWFRLLDLKNKLESTLTHVSRFSNSNSYLNFLVVRKKYFIELVFRYHSWLSFSRFVNCGLIRIRIFISFSLIWLLEKSWK